MAVVTSGFIHPTASAVKYGVSKAAVAISADTGELLPWGTEDNWTFSQVPGGGGFKTVNVTERFGVAVRDDGTVHGWAGSTTSMFDGIGGITDAQYAMVAVLSNEFGNTRGLAILRQDGTVTWHPDGNPGTLIPGLENVVAMYARGADGSQDDGILVIYADGTVGDTDLTLPPVGGTALKAAAYKNYGAVLKESGELSTQTFELGGEFFAPVNTTILNNINNDAQAQGTTVTAIDMGAYHTVAGFADGGVVAYATDDNAGQATVPASLPPAAWIFAGQFTSFAVDEDGFLHHWGQETYGLQNVPSVAVLCPEVSPLEVDPECPSFWQGLVRTTEVDKCPP